MALFQSCVLCGAGFQLDENEYRDLDALALSLDPDRQSGKSSNWQNFTEYYAYYLGPIKNQPIKMLEIGIYKGCGVKLWENYLPHAELHFMDISFDKVEYFSNRSRYYLADQGKWEDLQRVIAESGGKFDVIIDDGGHTMQQQITSFKALFPHLKKGGLYIIEDLGTSYWREYGGHGSLDNPKSGPGTTIQFLKDLVDEVNFVGARTFSSNHRRSLDFIEGELNIYRREIFGIHFYDCFCVIIKR